MSNVVIFNDCDRCHRILPIHIIGCLNDFCRIPPFRIDVVWCRKCWQVLTGKDRSILHYPIIVGPMSLNSADMNYVIALVSNLFGLHYVAKAIVMLLLKQLAVFDKYPLLKVGKKNRWW